MEKKNFEKKWNNYWYYYKYHTIAALFVVMVVVILIISLKKNDSEIKLSIVDITCLLNHDASTELLNDFTENSDFGLDEIEFKNRTKFIDEETAKLTGNKDIKKSIESGDIDILFVIRSNEYDTDLVGNIELVLSEEDNKLFSDYIVNYIDKDNDGKDVITDIKSGIIVNNAKRFKEMYGEFDYNIVVQIPESASNKENAIEFIKYLFEF